MVNNACITSPHFQRYIQAPILHGKVSDFSTKVPQARHIGQTRADQSDTKVKHPPWPFLQHAQCWAEGQQQSSTNPTELTTQSLRKKSRPPNTVLMQHHPIHLKGACVFWTNTAKSTTSAKASVLPRQEVPTTSPSQTGWGKVRSGSSKEKKRKKFKKVALTSPSRIAAWFSPNLHQDVK